MEGWVDVVQKVETMRIVDLVQEGEGVVKKENKVVSKAGKE